MYVDESGDTGMKSGSSRYFVLSGIVIHESRWRNFINHLVAHRKILRQNYGLPLRAEIHANEYIQKPIHGIEKHNRLAILRNTLDELAKFREISITNIVVNKSNRPDDYDVFQAAWATLFQRFENTLNAGNFPGGHENDYGIVITDATSGRKLTQIMRKMAVYNPVPNDPHYGDGYRNLPIVRIIEDPSSRDSAESLPIQACDLAAYFLTQRLQPNAYVRKKHAHRYFDRLLPVLNTNASRYSSLGIVSL